MLHCTIESSRPKARWEDYIKTEEDYDLIMSSGMAYVYFPTIPNWVEFKEYLNSKEKEVVAD